MARSKVLALVLAGGKGSRLDVLTDHRAKPSLPFAGVYRLIDFSLSNLANSGISDVCVLVQYHGRSILDTLANGRPWDLDRTHGGLRIVPPQQRTGDEIDGELVPAGNADAIHSNLDLIRAERPDVVLVLSADHVYRFDYWTAIDHHLRTGADATIVTTRVPLDDASNYGVCEIDGDGRVTGFAYKPEDPGGDVVATEIFVYTPAVLIDTLQRLAEADDDRLEDFGNGLIPELVERGTVVACDLGGYWKDLGRPETYFAAHMDLLAEEPDLELDDPAWPILTLAHQRMPATIRDGAAVRHALISPGCDIAGTVERSVLSPGVRVEAGATVRDAVILDDAVVRSGATVEFAIIDRRAEIGRAATVGEAFQGEALGPDDLVLVGQHATLQAGAEVPAGERIGAVNPLAG